MNSNERFNQLEELMSNLTRNVDRLTEKMNQLETYTFENNKVINSILHKLDDQSEQFGKHSEQFEKHSEQFDKHDNLFQKILDEMTSERKLRDAQFELVMKRFDYLDPK